MVSWWLKTSIMCQSKKDSKQIEIKPANSGWWNISYEETVLGVMLMLEPPGFWTGTGLVSSRTVRFHSLSSQHEIAITLAFTAWKYQRNDTFYEWEFFFEEGFFLQFKVTFPSDFLSLKVWHYRLRHQSLSLFRYGNETFRLLSDDHRHEPPNPQAPIDQGTDEKEDAKQQVPRVGLGTQQ